MSEIDQMKAGVATLEAEEKVLDVQRRQLRDEENDAKTRLRKVAQELRRVRQARLEIERRIREAENPSPTVTPEVETIIQSVTATVQASTGPPSKEG
jgi:chromosome segregation ATPase